MKSLLFALLLAFPAFGAKAPAYVAECRVAAIKKLNAKAHASRLVLIEKSVRVTAIDDRIWNPWKYVWFAGVGVDDRGRQYALQTQTQKSFLPLVTCF